MKLKKLVGGRYRLEWSGASFEANAETMMLHLKDGMGIVGEEVDYTFCMLEATGHDTADLGNGGTFHYAYSSRPVNLAVRELEAIRSVRKEFDSLYREAPESSETRNAWDRLVSLYIGLNVDTALEALKPEESKLAA